MLLFVANVVLSACLYACTLNTADGAGEKFSSKVGIGTETFPVASACRRAAKTTGNGSQEHRDTLVAILKTHGLASLVCKTFVPGSTDIDTSWEQTDKTAQSSVSRHIRGSSRGLTQCISHRQENLEDIDREYQGEAHHQSDQHIVLAANQILVILLALYIDSQHGNKISPVVKFTFSSKVNCSTTLMAFLYASAQSPDPEPQGLGYPGGEIWFV
jgi:predicted small secreted protein